MRRKTMRLSDLVKEHWEDSTTALFVNHGRERGLPDYEFVRRQERPDRVIRVKATPTEIGVEVTFMWTANDARLRNLTFRMGDAIVSVLEKHAQGGHLDVYAGEFPGVEPKETDDLVAELETAIAQAGGLEALVAGDDGRWERSGTVWHIEPSAGEDHWSLASNGVAHPHRRELGEGDLDALLLERVRDKVAKRRDYPWSGPLFLLVRNPYQAYEPGADALAEAKRLVRHTFDQAWLINYTEGTADLRPPLPLFVPLFDTDWVDPFEGRRRRPRS